MPATETPTRIVRSRRKGWRLPPGCVCVTRPGKWGNPFLSKSIGRVEAVRLFKMMMAHKWSAIERRLKELRPGADELESCVAVMGLQMRAHAIERDLHELRGKSLACWCPVGSPCHADFLLELAAKE